MRTHLVLVGLLLVSMVAGVAPVAGQEADVTLTVTVVSESGTAIGGATIQASWDGGSVRERTANNGKAFVDVPEGADVELVVESDQYIRNQPLRIEDARSRDVTVTVAPKGQLTVTANDTEGDVEDARVRLLRGGEIIVEGRTDADGTFTTPEIEQGEYFVEVFKQGYYRNLTRDTIAADTTMTVPMRRGTTNVEFRVVDDHFSPPEALSEASIEVEGIGTQRVTRGTVTFTVPVNSRYTVTADKEGYEANTTNIFVGATGEDHTLTINRERALNLTTANERVVVGETVQVTVRNAYDERVEGATVLLDGESVDTTGSDGTARIRVTSSGDHTLVAELDDVSSGEITVQGISTATATSDATPTDATTPTDTPTNTGAPGFTPVVAVVALLAVALLTGRFAPRSR